MKDNLLIIHGGAPTAVMNASLYGAIKAAKESGIVSRVFGARGGTRGALEGDYIDLSVLPEESLEALPSTPASYIGTSRFPVETEDYYRIVDSLVENNIKYLLFNGGNGSMDTCGKIAKAIASRAPAKGIKVAGIPKTIDNDIAATDHAPGFGSAARYLAASVAELSQDIASLPIHVCVVESMGRNAGWLTASAALAKPSAWQGQTLGAVQAPGAALNAFSSRAQAAGVSMDANKAADNQLGPHLIYVPEVAFDEEKFLDEAKTLYNHLGGVVVVASEGLRDKKGKTIVPPIFQTGRSVYYGDVCAHLCGLVIRKLGIKARSEKPGVLGRCSIAHQSPIDREEAIVAGKDAVKAVLSGQTGVMVAFRRLSSRPYACETFLVPVEELVLFERTLPYEYLNAAGNGIDDTYLDWCRPLLGGPLATFASRP